MRIFTLICSLLLIALGATGYYGWTIEGEAPQTLVSAIPAGFGALLLFGVLVALLLRRTGLQIALLAAIAGAFSGLGRLTPDYLGESLDWKNHPTNLIVAMSVVCLLYLIVRAVTAVLPKRPRREAPRIESADETPESLPC